MKQIVEKYEKYQAISSLLFYTGLRLEELVNLKRSDINLEERIVTVRNTKGKMDKVCPFTKDTTKLIKIYFLREREISNAFNITSASVYQTIVKIGDMLGYEFTLHPHIFRHSAGHYWLKETNNNLVVVQKILGHSDVKTTMLYLQLSNIEAIETVQEILKRKNK